MITMNPELTIRTAGRTRVIRLDGERYSLGRLRSNDLSFPDDSSLSKQHMALEREGPSWVVLDLGSRNGTFVNGLRVAGRQRLEPGDAIRAGQTTLKFGAAMDDETVVFSSPDANPDIPTAVRTNLEQALHEQRALDAAERISSSSLTAVLRAGRELAARRPTAELFPVILELATEAAGAKRGVLLTMEDERLIVRATRGDEFRISTTVRDSVLRDKTSLLVPDTSLDAALRERDSIVVQRVRTLMAVPLQTDEQVIGLLYLDTPAGRRWTADDLNLITIIANIAALRLERERLQRADEIRRLLAAELQQAAEIQRRFLPAESPVVRGLDFAGYNAPSRSVGGDYYDFLVLPDGRIGCVLADVAGKGMPAALVMMNLQARVQVLSETLFEPAAFMTTLDRVMRKNCPDDRFITVFYCVLDPASGSLVYANAGHNPPFVARANGTKEWLREGGPILGVLPDIDYRSAGTTLAPGDMLVIYSDGLTEAADPHDAEFGEPRLATLVAAHRSGSAQDLVNAIRAAIEEWSGGTPPKDDLTMLVVKRS
jgi:sigma-B regulation protein RsbU (phosphoserine phosphatase)